MPLKDFRLRDLYRWWLKAASRGRIRVGARARIERGFVFDMREGGSVSIGRRCGLRPGAMIIPHKGHIRIGDNFSLNPYSILYGHGGLTIGNDVRIAAHTVVIPANHVFRDTTTPIRKQGLTRQGITIGNDVWIGANVTVLDGASIGEGCVIAAGSVVRGVTDPYCIYAGVPAKRIGRRGEQPGNDRPREIARGVPHEAVSSKGARLG